MEESLEDCAIWIGFLPKSLLDSIFPLPFEVPLAVGSVELSVAMRLVEIPFSLIVAAIFVDHDPKALSTVLDPVANVVKSLSFVDHDAQALPSLTLLADEDPFWKFGKVCSGYFGIVVRV